MSKKKKFYFCDTETHGLYGEIALFQYGTLEGKPKYIEYPDPKWVLGFVNTHRTVWYNASYDLGTIQHQSGGLVSLNAKFYDLFYAGRTAYPELNRYGMDVFHDYFGMSYYNPELDKKKMQKSFATVSCAKARKATPDQIQYALADIYTLRDIWKKKSVRKVIKENKAYKLDIQSLHYSLHYQTNGIPVQRDALHKEQAALVDRIEANTLFLDGLNPNSPKQVCAALGSVNSSKETMVKLMSEGNELAEVVYEQRRLLKARGMLSSWDYDRIYTFFNPAGTVTGRFSSSGGDVGNGYVNSQQISRQYQYMFHSGKGRTTFEVDYSTAELRAGCSIMGDPVMYEELKTGKDLHIEAAKLTGITDPTREDRQKGKAVSFGLIFSMSAPSFKEYAFVNYDVNFSDRKAKKIHGNYHQKYQGISKYQDHCWRSYKTLPFESAMGRRNICRLGTDASNYSTQSTIAEATKFAVHFLVKKYPEALGLIINVVHDAVYMDVPDAQFKRWSKRLGRAMVKGWDEVCKSDLLIYKDIPMPAEVEIIGE